MRAITLICICLALCTATRIRSRSPDGAVENKGGNIFQDLQPENVESAGITTENDGTNSLDPNLTDEEGDQMVTAELKEPEPEVNTLEQELEEQREIQTELQSEHDTLSKEKRELESDVAEEETTLDETHKANQETITALRRTAQDMDAYNRYLEDKDSDSDDDGYLTEAHASLVFISALGSFFLILHGIRMFLGSSLDSIMKEGLMELMKDVTLLAILSILTAILNHMDVFNETQIDFRLLFTGIALFILIWFCVGMWVLLACQSVCRYWSRLETRCINLEALREDFTDAYEDLEQTGRSPYYMSEHRAIQYAVTRFEFINPTSLPQSSEAYLRDDFDFAEYLGRCLVKIYTQTIRLGWGSFVFIIFAAVIWRMIVHQGEVAQLIAFAVVPLAFVVTMFIVLRKLINVYYGLVPYIENPHDISFPRNNEYQRDPYTSVNRIPRPPYLEGTIISADIEHDNSITLCGKRLHPFKLSWNWLINGQLPNRHEVLFWFDSAGPAFIEGIVQAVCVTMTLWVIVVILSYIPILTNELNWYAVFAIIATVIIWAFLQLYMIPETLRLLCMTAKIGHMKDREVIDEVSHYQMQEREQRNVRVYRQFKMIRRELLNLEQKKDSERLPTFMVEFLKSVFKLHLEPDCDYITLDKLEDVMHMCGIDPRDDELRLIAKEATDSQYRIYFAALCSALEGVLAESTADPAVVVKRVLRRFFDAVTHSRNTEHISVGDLKNFFEKYHWHFAEHDITEFLHEIRYLIDSTSNLSISEIASLIRDDVETFPK